MLAVLKIVTAPLSVFLVVGRGVYFGVQNDPQTQMAEP